MEGGDGHTDATTHARYDPWDQIVPSCGERFRPLTGMLLQAKVKEYYFMPNATNLTLSWYLEDGSPHFRRHPLNDRDHQDAVREYAEIVRDKGILEDARGTPLG